MEEAGSLFSKYEDLVSSNIKTKQEINIVYDLFVTGINEMKKQCIPTKKIKNQQNDPKWMTTKVKKNLTKQKTLHRKMLKQNTCYATNQYKNNRKINKKMVQQAKRTYMNKKLYKPLLTGNSKPFYNHLKESRKNESNLIPSKSNSQNIKGKSYLTQFVF